MNRERLAGNGTRTRIITLCQLSYPGGAPSRPRPMRIQVVEFCDRYYGRALFVTLCAWSLLLIAGLAGMAA